MDSSIRLREHKTGLWVKRGGVFPHPDYDDFRRNESPSPAGRGQGEGFLFNNQNYSCGFVNGGGARGDLAIGFAQ